MKLIKNNSIYITRGDTFPISIDILNVKVKDSFYSLQENDRLVFTCRKDKYDHKFLFSKTFDKSGRLIILPEDTINVYPGTYYFDVRLFQKGVMVSTIIDLSAFIVLDSTACHCDIPYDDPTDPLTVGKLIGKLNTIDYEYVTPVINEFGRWEVAGKDTGVFAKGEDGLSSYEIAVFNGFEGTEVEWLASLKGIDGASAYQIAVMQGFPGSEMEWLHSLKGKPGRPGPAGQSAYDTAVEYGFVGTPQEWVASLKGKDGRDGNDGKSAYDLAVSLGFEGSQSDWISSLKGKDGVNGSSAYQLALAQGFDGDVNCWLASLKGTDGASAFDIAKEYGYQGTVEEWLADLAGPAGPAGPAGEQGASAYQIAVMQGFAGSEEEWLLSLKGISGADGKSAYEVAVFNGFEGSQKDWLISLQGKSAYQVAVDNGFKGTEKEWLESLVGSSVGEITKEQLGLDKVDNTPDAEKQVLSASKLTNPVDISFNGAFTTTAQFDGSKNIEFTVENVDATKLFGIIPVANLPQEALQGSSVQADWSVTDEDDPAFIKNKPTSFDVDLTEIENKLAKKVEISGDIIEGCLMLADAKGNIVCGPKPEDLSGSGSGTVVAGVTISVEATVDGASTIEVPSAIGAMFTLYHNGQLLLEDMQYIVTDNIVTLLGFTTYTGDIFTFIGYSGAGGVGVATDTRLGLVKSSTGLNKVVVAEDGTMYIAQLDMGTLVTHDGSEEIVLNGGSSM